VQKKELSFSSVVASWFMASRPRSTALLKGLAAGIQAKPLHAVVVVAGAVFKVGVGAVIFEGGHRPGL
jgi:hypothetical protein